MMQIVTWVGAPALLRRGATTTVMTVFLITFLFEYLPKIYHSVCILRRMQNFSGHVFGTIWWGIALNLMVYFVASHVGILPLPLTLTCKRIQTSADHCDHIKRSLWCCYDRLWVRVGTCWEYKGQRNA